MILKTFGYNSANQTTKDIKYPVRVFENYQLE